MSFRLGFEYASTSFSIGGPFRRPNGSLQSDLFGCQNGYPKTIAFGHPSCPGGHRLGNRSTVNLTTRSREHGKLDDSCAFSRGDFGRLENGSWQPVSAGTLPNIMRDLGFPPGGVTFGVVFGGLRDSREGTPRGPPRSARGTRPQKHGPGSTVNLTTRSWETVNLMTVVHFQEAISVGWKMAAGSRSWLKNGSWQPVGNSDHTVKQGGPRNGSWSASRAKVSRFLDACRFSVLLPGSMEHGFDILILIY